MEASTHTTDDECIANDVLRGAVAIGRELGEPPSRIYKLWQTGRLVGAWKDGRDLFASKRALRRAHANRARTTNK